MKTIRILSCLCLLATTVLAQESPLRRADFPIRDPFVVVEEKSGTYYLYASANMGAFGKMEGTRKFGVMAYTSKDLQNWTKPKAVLTLETPGVTAVWAPECHRYNGKYYIFATLTFNRKIPGTTLPKRGTWIFESTSPSGPFQPITDDSTTPPEWSALDGTLYVENGKPYMIFCHEWTQITDGTMCLQELSTDLRRCVGKPRTLFAASSAPNARKDPKAGKVTDGPFLYRSAKSGSLYMLWSTFPEKTPYCVLVTRSQSGTIAGPWERSRIIASKDGGHPMVFRSFDGTEYVSVHQPNSGGRERLHLFRLLDDGTSLNMGEELPFAMSAK